MLYQQVYKDTYFAWCLFYFYGIVLTSFFFSFGQVSPCSLQCTAILLPQTLMHWDLQTGTTVSNLALTFFFEFLMMCICVGIVCTLVQGPEGRQKRTLDPMELEVYIGSCEPYDMDDGNQTLYEQYAVLTLIAQTLKYSFLYPSY